VRQPEAHVSKEKEAFPMKVNLKFFSSCREAVGARESDLDIAEGATLRDLFQQLLARYPKLAPLKDTVMLAVNRDFADPSTKLKEGDEIALMPPVGGG